MNCSGLIRIFLLLAFTLTVVGVGLAQTPEQTINVRILPTSTVEEKVANEAKEKQLRKEAEEKQAAEEAARIEATSPQALLSHARILYIRSSTEYFESVQLQNALRKRSEVDAWQIAMIDDWNKRSVADTEIEIDRPLFTFTFTYKITNQRTGIVLATGKITAWDGDVAAPMLAERIVAEIRKARGESKAKK